MCLSKVGLKWDKLVGITIDGCPRVTGKNAGLLKRMQNQVTARNPKQKLVFLNCIIHQEVLCKSLLKIGNVTDLVIKIFNFIRARAFQHRQLLGLLEDHETEHGDICHHTNIRRLSLGEVLKQ